MQLSIPWSNSVSLFVIEMMAIIHSLKCTVPFSFAVLLLSVAVAHCHLLSLFVTCCHFVIRCYSLSFVVTRCTTRLSFYKRSFFFDSCKVSDLQFLLTTMILISVQKQPSEVFSKKRCSWKFRRIHKHLFQSLFRITASLKKIPWHRCSPVNFAKFLRTPFFYITITASESWVKQDVNLTDQPLILSLF